MANNSGPWRNWTLQRALHVNSDMQAILRQRQAACDAEKQVEMECRRNVDEKKADYQSTFHYNLSLPGAVGLSVGCALSVAADASPAVLAAVTEAEAALTQILPAIIPLAPHDAVVAAAVGLSAGAVVKTLLYATRRGTRRRADAELAAAKQQLDKQASKRRRVESEALDASRVTKCARKVLKFLAGTNDYDEDSEFAPSEGSDVEEEYDSDGGDPVEGGDGSDEGEEEEDDDEEDENEEPAGEAEDSQAPAKRIKTEAVDA